MLKNGLLMEKKKVTGSTSSVLCLIFVIRRENGLHLLLEKVLPVPQSLQELLTVLVAEDVNIVEVIF